MPIPKEQIAPTLQRVLARLLERRDDLSTKLLQGLRDVAMTDGPKLAQADEWERADAALACLKAISQLPNAGDVAGDLLPPELEATGFASVSFEELEPALKLLVQFGDFRVYSQARAVELLQPLRLFLTENRNRLTPQEQAGLSGALAALDQRLAEAQDQGLLDFQIGEIAVEFFQRLDALLGHHPPVRERLDQAKAWRADEGMRGAASRSFLEESAYAEETLPGGTAERFANVDFPEKVLRSQKRIPLTIVLAGEYETGSRLREEEAHLELHVGELTVQLHLDGFDILGSYGGRPDSKRPDMSRRIVEIAQESDSEALVFILSPQSDTPAGPKRIAIDFYQSDRLLRTVSFTTHLVDQEPITALSSVNAGGVPITSTDATYQDPPDLELRVTLAGDDHTLRFMLHSHLGDYHFQDMGEVRLDNDPRRFLKNRLNRLNEMARVSWEGMAPLEREEMQKELARMGAGLFRELFPEALQEALWEIYENETVQSLLITSDEPWIPWEMVKPFDARTRREAPYLCERFQVSRWLAGNGLPNIMRVHQSAIVVPGGNLTWVEREKAYFKHVAERTWLIQVREPVLQTRREVIGTLAAGDTQLFHFASHGDFDYNDPDNSPLVLQDGVLRPADIEYDVEAGVQASRPLIFLNACHTAEMGRALVGLGGWAESFLRAGASAFVGTLWEVYDQLAAEFAIKFYDFLWGLDEEERGQHSLGEAFHKARLYIRDKAPGNPTWLAYVLYGDPEGGAVLGNGE
ncbi:MAG TPA: CHAT domain-containing protein [Anaerolineae bacterium]|nr:CHAT domain-containing protein [Anaerolineae bacterium]